MIRHWWNLSIMTAIGFNAAIQAMAMESAHRVHIVVVRRESAVHTSLTNRDVYLVRVTCRSGNTFPARVIDEYPGYADGAPVEGFSKDASISVELRRAPYCDRSTGTSADSPIRCFTLVHGSWRIREQLTPPWWK